MNEKVSEFRMHLHGFTKKMNLWVGYGATIELVPKSFVWKISVGMSEEREVVTYQDVFDYIANPPAVVSSRKKYY